MKRRINFQIIRGFSQNSIESTERIDSLLINFEKSIKEMKKYLQESGYSRRYFIKEGGISDEFKDESLKFQENILKRFNEFNEFEICKSILNLGTIFRFKEAENLFKEGKLKYKESSNIYSSMIYAYGKVGKYYEALKLFEEANLKNLLNKKMFDGLLEAYSVHVEKVILRYDDNNDGDNSVNNDDNNNVNVNINNYFNHFNNHFNHFNHFNVNFERVLMEISIEPALKIYSNMIKLNFKPNISTLTRIIRLAGRLKKFSIIEEIQRESERFSIKFDIRAYEVLIFAQINCDKIEEAEETLKIVLNQFKLEEFEYLRFLNLMLFGYCKLKRPLEANRIIKLFENEFGVKQPSNISISFLICTLSKCGFIYEAENLYKKLKLSLSTSTSTSTLSSSSSNLLTSSANNLLSAYLRNDDFKKFFSLIDELDLKKRDKYTNSMIFEGLSRFKDEERLIKELELTKLTNLTKLSPMELSSLFKCLFSYFDDNFIKEFINYVINENNNENCKEIEIILLNVFSKLKEWNKCLELVKSLIKIKVEPNFFLKLIESAGPNPEKIEFTLNWMKKLNCWRDPTILTKAMELYYQSGAGGVSGAYSKESRELWNEIKSKRNKAKSFSIAISCMSQILLNEEGPISALNHLNNYKTLWNNSSIQVYLKSLRLLSLNQSKDIESFFFENVIKMNQPPSIEVINEVLISILPNKEILNRIINWMCKSGCHPNVQTMNILLGENGNFLFEAEFLLDEMIKVGGKPSNELLLRIIPVILENSPSKAESYSKILLNRDSIPLNIRLNLFLNWKKYFEKIGRSDKIDQIQIEIDKILK